MAPAGKGDGGDGDHRTEPVAAAAVAGTSKSRPWRWI